MVEFAAYNAGILHGIWIDATGELEVIASKSLAEYAQELTEETTEIPDHLAFYLDYEAMGRDMALGCDVFTIETGFEQEHIFWNH